MAVNDDRLEEQLREWDRVREEENRRAAERLARVRLGAEAPARDGSDPAPGAPLAG